jgi:hypothetical protein
LNGVRVCPLDHTAIPLAASLSFTNFEDAVQVAAAVTSGLDAVVTRNLADYRGAPVPVYSPTDFLAHLPTS